MNKPTSFPPKDSLLERASEAFDFTAALRGQGLPPLIVPDGAEHIEPTASAGAAAAADKATTPPVTTAPTAPTANVPVIRARDWSGPIQPLNRKAMAEAGYLIPDGPVSGLSEEFRIVKRELLASIRGTRQQEPQPNGNVILVASAHSGDGKTYCAINLAISLAAEADLEVLLVDADFGKPSIIKALGLHAETGFMDALTDPTVAIERCVIPTDAHSLFVLPSGQSTNRDAEYLTSSRMEQIIASLISGRPNRIVIFDSPPLLAASPAAALATHAGQTLLVVRADRTSDAALRDACNLLRGGGPIRLLLNGVKFSASGRRFGTYYGKEGEA